VIPFGDDVSVKSLTDLDFIGLGTRPALWVDGVLTAPTSSSFLGSIGAQASLGYTPVNKAGDTMSGALALPTLNVGHSQVTQGSTAAISEGAEVLLVRAQYLIGEVEIFWNGAANRVERMLIDVSSLNYYDGEVLSITRYVSYQNAAVFGTVRLRQDAGSTMRYLTVTVQNLNGGTAGISVVVRAMSNVAYTFGEALPGGTTVLKSITGPSRADHLVTTGNLRLVNLTASRMLSLDGNQRIIALDAAGNRSLIGAAALDSPAFTGVPTAPTASAGTNTTQLATTAFVRAELAALIASAPGALDTLDELAAALGDDPNFATTVTTSIAGKVSKAGDSMTGELTMANDGLGLTLYGAARIYKKVGTGLVTRLHSGNVRMQVENNAGVILGTYWDSGNLASPIQGSGSAGKIPKFATSSTLGNSLLDDTGTEIVQSSGLFRIRNANLANIALAFTKGADTESAFVAYMDGKFEWGSGSTTRDTNLYRLTANFLKTDDAFMAAGGFRAVNYESTALSGTGPGIEVHYDSAGSGGSGPRARVLGYDRTAAARIALALDGSPIDFYANGFLKARINANGDLSLVNLTASRALVSDASNNLVSSATSAQQIAWLSSITSNVQTQLDGKVSTYNGVVGVGLPSSTSFSTSFIQDIFGTAANGYFLREVRTALLAPPSLLGNFASGIAWKGADTYGSMMVAYDQAQIRVSGGNLANPAWTVDLWHSGNFTPSDVNLGSTLEGAYDPFHATQRFTNHDKRGGVRTWNGIGPFLGSAIWYNVVDARHRNGAGDGTNGYGGELVWGMVSYQNKMAFRSRAADGTPTSWTEVWTKAEISDSNMPRRNAINNWTGSNAFISGIDLRSIDPQVVRAVLPTGVIRGTHDGDGVTPRSTIWHGGDGGGPAILQSPSRGQIGHLSIANTGSDGLFTHASDPYPYLLDWGSDGININKVTRFGLTSDIHTVNGSDLVMTKMRAKVTDSTARATTLPSATSHSIAIIMVYEDALTGFHNVYPPTGSEIYWTDHTGTSRYTVPSGGMVGSAFRISRGMYWFASDGANWYAMSPARN
jgi:hypothetical protein